MPLSSLFRKGSRKDQAKKTDSGGSGKKTKTQSKDDDGQKSTDQKVFEVGEVVTATSSLDSPVRKEICSEPTGHDGTTGNETGIALPSLSEDQITSAAMDEFEDGDQSSSITDVPEAVKSHGECNVALEDSEGTGKADALEPKEVECDPGIDASDPEIRISGNGTAEEPGKISVTEDSVSGEDETDNVCKIADNECLSEECEGYRENENKAEEPEDIETPISGDLGSITQNTLAEEFTNEDETLEVHASDSGRKPSKDESETFVGECKERVPSPTDSEDADIPPEVNDIIRKLSGMIDENLRGEVLKALLSGHRKSVTSEVPQEDQEMTEPAVGMSEVKTISEQETKNTDSLVLEHRRPSTLDVKPEETSENLLLDLEDGELQCALTSPCTSIDIVSELTPTITELNKLPLESDTGSTFADQEDQGVYLPIPEFPSQSETQTGNQQSWKVGYLQVKLPHKARGRGKLKVWQKKLVVIQPDEFFDDRKNRSLILSIYQSDSSSSRRHNAAFWKSVCSKSAFIYRSVSRTHPYAFTVSDDQGPIIHLAADSETETQEWMAAIRNVLWPPSSVMQIEKVLNGNEFEVSVIENDFAYRAGLLGTYGYLAVTGRKLILCHPQSEHVIQEWYLNTVDNFRLLPMPKEVDANKVLVMHTTSESSTGCGELKFFCSEAVAFLQSLASTIHQVLQHHTKENKGCYEKELEEISHWLIPQQPTLQGQKEEEEDYYKVPPRQVRSLLDIPNFIFDGALYAREFQSSSPPGPKLKPSTTCVSNFSSDSGISVATGSSEDFLNCSQTSFTIGNRSLRKHDRTSSGSDLSDAAYTPPITPDTKRRVAQPDRAQKAHEI